MTGGVSIAYSFELTSGTQDESPVESWQGARRIDLGETGLAFLGVVGTGHDPEREACLLEPLSGASARCREPQKQWKRLMWLKPCTPAIGGTR